MKNLLYLPLLYILCVAGVCNSGNEAEVTIDPESEQEESKTIESSDDIEDSDKAFQIKSGKMVSSVAGIISGEESLIWEDYGLKQRKETNTLIEFGGMKQEQKAVSLIIGDDVWSLDEAAKTATHLKNDFMGGADMSQQKEFGYELMEQWGGKKIGEKEFLGKTVEVWKIESMKAEVWFWKGLTVYIKIDMMEPSQVTEAKSIETDINIPESTWSLEGYEIKEMGNISNLLGN